MLNCGACRERCLQSIVGNSVFSTSARPSIVSNLPKVPLSRNYSGNGTRKTRRLSDIDPSRRKHVPWLTQKKTFVRSSANEDENAKRPNITPTGPYKIRRRDSKLEQSMGSVLEKHPAYGNDPLKLAEFVRKALRGDDFDTAAAVVRAASKNIQCTVSWNHLIDWEMSKGRMSAALKTYNEMKKRGQSPDSHTFTIIIRGCTEHRDVRAALGKVMAIYQSMQTDKSPIKPNTIHLNAIIKMCARAKDIDAMFGIMSQMPDYGQACPNNLTFTTVINALRMNAAGDLRGDLTPLQKRNNARAAILKARHLWKDIIRRWRVGGFWVDEELVCAMGRLMLLGDERDRDDILSLIEQTMDVPRQIARIGTSERNMIEPSSQGNSRPLIASKVNPTDSNQVAPESESESESDFTITTLPRKPSEPGQIQGFAKPGRNSLSLVMEALALQQQKNAADKYWQIFVNDLHVKPDAENYHTYLRILRVNRASTMTVELLQSMRYDEMRAATFIIAMAAAERDKRNPNAFANAGKILDIMTTALEVPHIKPLISYLEIATSGATASHGLNLSRLDQGKQILRALHRLGPSFINIKSFFFWGETKINPGEDKRQEYRDDILVLTRRMIAAYDILMEKALIDRSRYSEMTAERSKLAAFVTRQMNQNKDTVKSISKELPGHLSEYVKKHNLSNMMKTAHLQPNTWEKFVKRTEFGYQAEQKELQAVKEMQEEPASTSYLEGEDVEIEEESQAAKDIARNVFAASSN